MVVSVEGGGGDILGGKKASYRDYVDLWMHLMDPTHLKVTLHYITVYHSTLQYTAVYHSILLYTTVYYSI